LTTSPKNLRRKRQFIRFEHNLQMTEWGLNDLRVAVVHDRLCNRGGGEKVAITIAEALHAEIYTANYEPEKTYSINVSVHKTNPMPDLDWDKYYVIVRMLDAWSFARLAELQDYDMIWMSGMWAPFAARNNPKNVLYCHSPNRPIYDLADSLRKRYGLRWRPIFDVWRWFWERMDKWAVGHVKRIVCNSKNVRERIRKYWNRDAEVVYPPVDTSKFYYDDAKDYWLSVNRMMPEKRIDLQLDVFERLPDERLVIVGSAEYGTAYQREMEKRIEKMDNVEWLGRVSDEKLYELYAHCKGTIQTAVDEDFGYVPPESMAAGKPCLAVNEGGFRESIEHGRTGLLIDEPYVENFVKAIKEFDPSHFDPNYLRAYAQKFSKENFVRRVREITKEVLGKV
ncbi:MAG: glycosyltransferase, partial [Candidatus Hadarchaeales archaeon]